MSGDLELNPGQSEAKNLLRDEAFATDLRLQMLKFAMLHLPDAGLAEDAVQEAFIGALKNADSFGGRAALKTWVFTILKNKIADSYRSRQRYVDASSLLNEDEEGDEYSSLFDRKGLWNPDDRPLVWADPHESLRERRFWEVFELCLERLPAKQARIFMMRELIELDPNEVCETTGITDTNLYVILHRVRLRLRECLEDRWFVGDRKNA